MSRIAKRFAELRAADRAAFIAFIMAHDPDYGASLALMRGLPDAGADIIELGMPFSDPMADGPAIQRAGQRALASGATMRRTLRQVADFRADNVTIPVILMGYFNPVFHYGVEAFCRDASAAGVDGLILVDLPPEEEGELLPYLGGLDFIRLIAPTTGEARLSHITRHASGFLYYISVTGVTGAGSAAPEELETAVARIRGVSDLPLAIGFGIKTPQQVAAATKIADAVVVGSALVDMLAETGSVDRVLQCVRDMTAPLRISA